MFTINHANIYTGITDQSLVPIFITSQAPSRFAPRMEVQNDEQNETNLCYHNCFLCSIRCIQYTLRC